MSTARRVRGLEAALRDNFLHEVTALDPADSRTARIRVAGPASLVIAKVTKIRERLDSGRTERVSTKDAADLLRLLRNVPPETIGRRLAELAALEALRSQVSETILWLADQLRPGPAATQLVELAIADRSDIEPANQIRIAFQVLGEQLLSSYGQ